LSGIKYAGWAEGTSFLILLGFAMPMKYLAGQPIYVSYIGMIHGILFMLYCGMLYLGFSKKKWTMKACIHGFIAAVLPAGPFVFDRMLESGKYDPE